jgi:phage gpG-like protein
VVFGTNVPYAQNHQRGGQETIKLGNRASTFKKNLRKLYAKGARRGDPNSSLPSGVTWEDIGWMFGATKFTIRIARRQFIAVTKRDEQDIKNIIDDFMQERAQ